MAKIYIDPGHGGVEPGAVYKGREEQNDMLKLALAVKKLLLTQKDIEVKLSRETAKDVEIDDRAIEANSWGADYFASFHRNAFKPNKASGAEVWCYSKVAVNGVTYKKAERILSLICEATGYKNRGVKLGAPAYEDFGVNRITNMSSCLLEIGFIDNNNDNAIFDKCFNKIALNIAKGLVEAVGKTWVDTQGTADKTESKPATKVGLYRVQVGAYAKRENAENKKKELKAKGIKSIIVKY